MKRLVVLVAAFFVFAGAAIGQRSPQPLYIDVQGIRPQDLNVARTYIMRFVDFYEPHKYVITFDPRTQAKLVVSARADFQMRWQYSQVTAARNRAIDALAREASYQLYRKSYRRSGGIGVGLGDLGSVGIYLGADALRKDPRSIVEQGKIDTSVSLGVGRTLVRSSSGYQKYEIRIVYGRNGEESIDIRELPSDVNLTPKYLPDPDLDLYTQLALKAVGKELVRFFKGANR